jgi:hypothetical protein
MESYTQMLSCKALPYTMPAVIMMQMGCQLRRTMILLRMACSSGVSASLPALPKATGACAAAASTCPSAELLLLLKVVKIVPRKESDNLSEAGAFCQCC